MTCMGKPGPDRNVTDCELVKAAQSMPDPCFTAVEIQEQVDLDSVGRVRTRLNELVEEEVLGRKSSGSGHVYWVVSLATA